MMIQTALFCTNFRNILTITMLPGKQFWHSFVCSNLGAGMSKLSCVIQNITKVVKGEIQTTTARCAKIIPTCIDLLKYMLPTIVKVI